MRHQSPTRAPDTHSEYLTHTMRRRVAATAGRDDSAGVHQTKSGGGGDGAHVVDDDGDDDDEKKKGTPALSTNIVLLPTLNPIIALTWVAVLVMCARWSVLFNVPAPLGLDADSSSFAEDRAMVHTYQLSETIGVRVVGTLNIERAERYVAEQARELVRVAKETRADDLDVDFMLHRTTGSFRLNFLNNDIANAYTNLTNIAVRIAPKGLGLRGRGRRERAEKGDDDDDGDGGIEIDPSVKAVLINGHFDTTLGSPGAADCASCVGIMLEALRVLIHNQPNIGGGGGGDASPSPSPEGAGSGGVTAPVVFLFNGGEETFMVGRMHRVDTLKNGVGWGVHPESAHVATLQVHRPCDSKAECVVWCGVVCGGLVLSLDV